MTVIRMPKPKASGDYRIVNKGNDRGEVCLYGSIGQDWFSEGVTAKQFSQDLKRLGNVSTIDLRINSDGGVVTDARSIYTLLVEHKAKVITHIDGIAASAASLIAMAGSEIWIAEGGFVMIHEVRGGVRGQADDLRRMADVLDLVSQTFVDTYTARTKQEASKIKKWMADETWFNSKDAVANGFADHISENMKVAASIADPSRFTNLPAALRPGRQRIEATLAEMRAAIK